MCIRDSFTTELNYNHHKFVATQKDPASAPKGRSLWYQVVQTVPNQFISAWRVQAKRSKSFLHNSVLHGFLLQIAFAATIWFIFGTWGLGALLYQAVISIFLLEYVNYICLLYTSPSPRDVEESRMPSSA